MTTPQGKPTIIVPPYRPEIVAVAPAIPYQLTYNNGTLLSAVQVCTIFWGTAWQQAPQSDVANNLNQFFDFILTSPLLDQLGEYNIAGGPTIGQGQRIGTVAVTTQDPNQTVADADIQNMLQQEIANDPNMPQPTANMLYFCYLPPGVTVQDPSGGASCQDLCGYHDSINGQIFYAIMPYPDCQGCLGPLAAFDALTSTSSHELCEAITDAVPGQGWYDSNNNVEIGDICAWQTKQVGNYTVQQEWSNQNNTCM